MRQLSIKVDNFPERNKAWYVLGIDSGPRSLVAMSEQATRSFLRQSKGIGFDDND